MPDILRLLLTRVNTKSASMLGALLLIGGGLYMCFAGLSAKGSIDMKAVFFQGKIETASLGLLAMFLGTAIAIVALLASNKGGGKGEEVRLTINGNQVVAKGLSHGKLVNLLSAVSSSSPPEQTEGTKLNQFKAAKLGQ